MRKMIAGVGVSVALLAGCGSHEGKSSSSQTNNTVAASPEFTCQADTEGNWSPTPSNINAEEVARALHVDPSAVRAGIIGDVVCSEALGTADAGTVMSIEKVARYCLIIGLRGIAAPTKDASTHKAIALCAASN